MEAVWVKDGVIAVTLIAARDGFRPRMAAFVCLRDLPETHVWSPTDE